MKSLLAQRSNLDTFDGFINTLRNHWSCIINYFAQRITSGFVEGLNNKIKTIKRRCYGISVKSPLFFSVSGSTYTALTAFFLSTT